MQVRFAGAPVSFGVDEVQADAWRPTPDMVVGAIAGLGMQGTELGPPEFLGTPSEARARLERHDLELVGAYFPLPFARDDDFAEALAELPRQLADLLARCPFGSQPKVILGDAFDQPERLEIAGAARLHPAAFLPAHRRARFVDNIHRAAEASQRAGLDAVVHPHAGTYIETEDEIRDVAERMDASLVGLCLDTGHIRLGGGVPARIAAEFRHLVRHVHAKDCDPMAVARVVHLRPGLRRAMEMNVFCELEAGDADIASVVKELDANDYRGWIVLEQDRKVEATTSMRDLTQSVRRNLEVIMDLVSSASARSTGGLVEPSPNR
jgi:inosose dehydratase